MNPWLQITQGRSYLWVVETQIGSVMSYMYLFQASEFLACMEDLFRHESCVVSLRPLPLLEL